MQGNAKRGGDVLRITKSLHQMRPSKPFPFQFKRPTRKIPKILGGKALPDLINLDGERRTRDYGTNIDTKTVSHIQLSFLFVVRRYLFMKKWI